MTKVATTVKLIVEPTSEDKLVDCFSETFLKDYKDEKFLGMLKSDSMNLRRIHSSGEEPFSTCLLGHFFDSKKCSEAASSPHLRPPPLKDNRLAKLLSAIVCLDLVEGIIL